jgi:hypothetical protein
MTLRVDLAQIVAEQGRRDEARALLVRALPLLKDAKDLQDVYGRGESLLGTLN